MNFALCGLAGTVLLAALVSCTPSKTATPPPLPKVTVSQPQLLMVTNWDEYPGHLEAVEMVEIRPRVSGYLESIHFQDGAEVKGGDLLFVIDPQPYQAELDRAEAERRRMELRLELARNDLQRVEGLRGTKAISEEEYDTRSKAAREAEAALAAAQAAERDAQIKLGYTRIKAPIGGRVGRRLVTVGNLVQSAGTATLLATLVTMHPMYCYFDVEEGLFLHYRTQAAEQGRLKQGLLSCDLALAGEEGYPHRGSVDFFDNQVDARTGTIRLRGVFGNDDRLLMPGMFARVRVPAGPPAPALLVPAVAIGSDQGRKYVLVVQADSRVESRPITVGRQHGALRAVTEGLTPEDRVVVNGLMMARPGLPVEVVDKLESGSAPAPGAAR